MCSDRLMEMCLIRIPFWANLQKIRFTFTWKPGKYLQKCNWCGVRRREEQSRAERTPSSVSQLRGTFPSSPFSSQPCLIESSWRGLCTAQRDWRTWVALRVGAVRQKKLCFVFFCLVFFLMKAGDVLRTKYESRRKGQKKKSLWLWFLIAAEMTMCYFYSSRRLRLLLFCPLCDFPMQMDEVA